MSRPVACPWRVGTIRGNGKLMLRLLRRQLVRKLGPFLFDHGAYLVRNDADMFDFQHVLMQPL
jgi:hypothetical protein